jgi:hypothetical protein
MGRQSDLPFLLMLVIGGTVGIIASYNYKVPTPIPMSSAANK